MASEWRVELVGNVATNLDSQRIPLSSREREERRGPYPYYGATGILDYVDDYLFEGLHVLIAEDGSVEREDGTPFVQLVDGKFWVNNHAHVLRGKSITDTRFLYYALSSVRIRSFVSGSVQAKLTQENLSRIPIPWPPEPERCAIAHILGTLDDKIELNRRMSETLEAMGRAIFKAWFVDFEPVRAKMEGRWRHGESLPGLPAHLYDLFPDRLVDSELGEIPEGWEVGVLGDVLTQHVDRCTPSDEVRSRPYVPIECIAGRSLLLPASKSGAEARSSLTRFRKGDLLFGAMRPYFHKVAIAPFDGTTRTTVFVLRPRQPDDFSFAALLLSEAKTIEYATAHSTGTTIPYALWEGSLAAMPIILPPLAVRKSFEQVVRPLLNRILPLFFANRTLTAMRDALLPKLIAGELRVKHAEVFLSEQGLGI